MEYNAMQYVCHRAHRKRARKVRFTLMYTPPVESEEDGHVRDEVTEATQRREYIRTFLPTVYG